jgi:hypothetical protein
MSKESLDTMSVNTIGDDAAVNGGSTLLDPNSESGGEHGRGNAVPSTGPRPAGPPIAGLMAHRPVGSPPWGEP